VGTVSDTISPVARIFVVGAGVVGTAVGRGFVEAGHSVTLVDSSADRVDALVAGGLDATTRLDLRGEPSSFVFLTVPTPAGPQGYDLRAMAVASRDVGRAIGQAHAERGVAGRHSNRRDARGEGEGYAVHTVVTRSTVPPGTTTQLVGPAIAQASGTAEGVGFVLAANPEFLRDSSAEDDVRWPWMTVVGARSRRVGERLAALLEPFGGELRVFDKPETAELVKCVHNLYNATKISFWNEMWLVARSLGLDPDDIAGTVSRSAEGSLNPSYGIRGGAPFAGRCLPKDTDGFLAFARELGLSMPLLDSVVGVNRELAEQVEGELEALSRGTGRVLDLREAERRDAVSADRRTASDRHVSDRHASERHVSDRHVSDRHVSDRHVSDRHASDRHVSDRHASDRHASEPPSGRAAGHSAPGYEAPPGVPDGYRGTPHGYGEAGGSALGSEWPEFVQDRPGGHDRFPGDDAYRQDGGFSYGARAGWEGRAAVPGTRDPVSGDLPTVGPSGRHPFTEDLSADGPGEQPYDGRDGRYDERW
jgi:UDPglucose 6-dehydrogenase